MTQKLLEHGTNPRYHRIVVARDRTHGSDDRYGPVTVTNLPGDRLSTVRAALGLGETLRSHAHTVDVVHNANIAVPVNTKLPYVATVFDLSPMLEPRWYSRHVRFAFNRSFSRLERGGVALTISQSTADAVLNHAPTMEGRVIAGPLGPSLTVTKPSQLASPHILYVGQFARRKRPDLVVRAFAKASLDADWKLTMVGGRGDAYAETAREVQTRGLSNRVELLSAISSDRLRSLYQGAAFFCLPSVLEGFGIPVLDAISHGLPAIVTDISSLREVAGAGGCFFPADDEDALVDWIRELAANEPERHRIGERGLQHAQRFSWRKHAASAERAYDLARVSNK